MSDSKVTTPLIAVALFALGVVATLVCEHLLFVHRDARDAMQTSGYIQDWRLSCAPRTVKKGTCVMQETIVQQGTRNVLAELNVTQKDGTDTLSVVTPLGVLVSPGIGLLVGNSKPRLVPFKTCLEMGCVALTTIDPELSDAMSHNDTGKIIVVNSQGKRVPLSFSLRGYADALSARATDMSVRNSIGS